MALLIGLVCGASAIEAAHLEVVLETDGAGFTLRSKTRRPRDAPKIYRKRFGDGWYYVECLGADGSVIDTLSVEDPTRVLYDYPLDPGSSAPGPEIPKPLRGGQVARPNGQLVLQIPDDPSITRLRISRQRQAGQARPAPDQPAAPAQPGRPAEVPEEIELQLQASVELGANE